MIKISDQPECQIAEAIRAWIRNGTPAARELLAQYGAAHCRSFLVQRRALRRFGFADTFAEVAAEVAGLEVAKLLRPEQGSSQGSPILLRRLAAALDETRSTRAPSDVPAPVRESLGGDYAQVVLDANDRALLLAYRRVLRLRADQGLQRRWADEHPEEARLLRRVKDACHTSTEIRLQRDSRGTFVVTRDSDLRKRALIGQEIRRCLDHVHAGPRAELASLRPLLAAGEEHGGYCYLMDFVREIHADHARRFVDWYRREAGVSGVEGIGANGVPLGLILEKMRRSLYELAEEILIHDRHQAPPEVRAIWCEVAVEMLLRKYGLSEDRHDPLLSSQRRLLESKLRAELTAEPPTELNTELAAESLQHHEEQTTYLVRRLRLRWER
jgi:hypothetical protein